MQRLCGPQRPPALLLPPVLLRYDRPASPRSHLCSQPVVATSEAAAAAVAVAAVAAVAAAVAMGAAVGLRSSLPWAMLLLALGAPGDPHRSYVWVGKRGCPRLIACSPYLRAQALDPTVLV